MFGENKFLVLDADGKVLKENDKRHILIKHEATFKLKFHNPYAVRMQVDLYLNGKVGNKKAFIGPWILKPGDIGIIETNEDNGQLFTFARRTSEAFFSEIEQYVQDEDNWGLVSVRFRTERDTSTELKRVFGGGSVVPCSLSTNTKYYSGTDSSTSTNDKSYNAGGIALSGSSDQKFGTTFPIISWGSVDSVYAIRLVEDKIKSLYKPTPIPEYNYPE